MSDYTGKVIRDFKFLSRIGSGGMGEVWLAEEAILGRKVAVKVLNPTLTGEEHFRQRFVNEAKIQASLQHPHIVGLYSFFEQDGTYYMALEYAEGITLKDLIARTGPIPEPRTQKILLQILNALQYAHAKGIIHRDIKPSNIMVDANDNIKVMDFGIARIMGDSHLTKTGLKVGTLYYMSPEQIVTPKEVDCRTDIYSTGIVLYEMLTGKLPFNTDTDSDFVIQKEIVDNALPDPRDYYPHISEAMIKLLYQMTAKDAIKRKGIDGSIAWLSDSSNHKEETQTITPAIAANSHEIVIGKHVWEIRDNILCKKNSLRYPIRKFDLSTLKAVGKCRMNVLRLAGVDVIWLILTLLLVVGIVDAFGGIQ